MLYDKDKSGTFSGFEFRDALTSAGYKLNSKVLNILMHRYGNSSGQLDFDDFMMCSVKLKTMIGKENSGILKYFSLLFEITRQGKK